MINQDRLKEIIREISFPRLSGTLNERKALNLIKEKISNLGFEYSIQEFKFSTFYGRIYPRIGFSLIYSIFFMLFLNIETILIPVLTLIIIATLILFYLFTRNPENIKFPIIKNSANLFTKLSPLKKETEKERNIFFFCHLDTKGQRLSILARVRAIRIYVFSLLILLIDIIFKNYILASLSLFFYIIGIVPLIASSVALILLMLNNTNNQSPGAIDDSSGVGCVFELLNHYSIPDNRLINFNLWFVFTGAEECGTMGIRNFIKKISNFDKNSTYFFNFDSIAKSVYLFPSRKSSNETRNLFFDLVDNDLGLQIKRNPKKIYFGSHSDGLIMSKKGFQGFGIADMDSYEYIHSKFDTPDKINYSKLKLLCEMIVDALNKFDKQL
jgi:hypothetical protein